ncbi:MAG: hypothetical protein EGW04_01245 [Rothia mucilaginosa]|nr:hypothetical protein [Rothia mucilaginosa]
MSARGRTGAREGSIHTASILSLGPIARRGKGHREGNTQLILRQPVAQIAMFSAGERVKSGKYESALALLKGD